MKLTRHFLFAIHCLAMLLVWYYLFLQMGIPNEDTMFSAVDARSYRNVAEWLFHGGTCRDLEIRTYLYPLALKIMLWFGVSGIWLIQSAMWYVTGILVFKSIRHFTGNMFLALAGGLIYATNLSLIALASHALTEVFVTFLMSILIYQCSVHRRNFSNISFISKVLLLMAVLAVTKPVYLPFLYVLLIIFLVVSGKKMLQKPTAMYTFFLAISVLLCQYLIYYNATGDIGISSIDIKTFNRYFYAKGYGKLHQIPLDSARNITSQMTYSAMLKSIPSNIQPYQQAYLENLTEHLNGQPYFLMIPQDFKPQRQFMEWHNNLVYHIHWFFPLLVLLGLYVLWDNKKQLIGVVGLSALNAWLFIVSGFSFGQGDRLVIPAMTIWIVLYILLIYKIAVFVRRK